MKTTRKQYEQRISDYRSKEIALLNQCIENTCEINRLKRKADRLLVLAEKWCNKHHHDYTEISKFNFENEEE